MNLTPEQIIEQLKEIVSEVDPSDLSLDNDGQVVIYTNIYKWEDGSFHNEPEDDDTNVFSVRSILNQATTNSQ